MSKVTYIYARDRKKNIENNTVEAKELYYSFHLFKEDGNDMNIIEYETKDNLINKFLYFYDRILNKFISIPINPNLCLTLIIFDIFLLVLLTCIKFLNLLGHALNRLYVISEAA